MLRRVLVGCCLVLVVLYLLVERKGRHREAVCVKGCASLCFVALGVAFARVDGFSPYARAVVVGLALGAIADVLIDLRHVYQGPAAKRFFVMGAAVFLMGHAAYLVACVPLCPHPVVAALIGVVLTVALMRWVATRIDASAGLLAFGHVYLGAVTVLACVAGFALVAVRSARLVAMTAGVILFLASDVLLILNNFGPNKRFSMRVANLSLYYAAQLLIATSVMLVA